MDYLKDPVNRFIDIGISDKYSLEILGFLNQFGERPWILPLISSYVGYMIVLVVSMIKVPQILKILKAQSGDGLSFFSQVISLYTSSVSVAYVMAHNYKISLWGETFSMAIQNFIICHLIILYRGLHQKALVFGVIYITSMLILIVLPWSTYFYIYLQYTVIPLSVLSKVFQICKSNRRKSTGQLSLTVCTLMVYRSAGRLFTTMVETDDMLSIFHFFMNSVLNSIIAIQVVLYRPDISNIIKEVGEQNNGKDSKLKADITIFAKRAYSLSCQKLRRKSIFENSL